MAGKKIFVSYKYHDSNVREIIRDTASSRCYPIVRDYVNYIQDRIFDPFSDHIYKGESDGEDLSYKSDEYIWEKLKYKIYDSTVTIVLISPNMKEPYVAERNQWIPQEISYSLKEMNRGGRISGTNALLAVILPDRYGSYDYYYSMKLFGILKNNIVNGYAHAVRWDNFIYNYENNIQHALRLQKVYADRVVKSI